MSYHLLNMQFQNNINNTNNKNNKNPKYYNCNKKKLYKTIYYNYFIIFI